MAKIVCLIPVLWVLGFVAPVSANTLTDTIETFFLEADFLAHHHSLCTSILSKGTAFQQYIHILKKKVRRGLRERGVDDKHGETIWEHTKMVAKAAKILGKRRGLDYNKMVFIAIVHDIAEAIANDYTPRDNVHKDKKHQEEWAAIQIIVARLHDENPNFADKVFEAWLDYEFQRNHEAVLVKQLDKVDAAVRASLYEKQGYLGFESYFVTPYEYLKDEKLKQHFDTFVKIRHSLEDPYKWYFATLE